MPCRSDEEETQIPEPPNPVTPTKPPRNDGAGYDNSDAEIPLVAEYEPVMRWVTCERAVLPEVDIERELFEEAHVLMHLSGLKCQRKVMDPRSISQRRKGCTVGREANSVPR